MFSNYGKLLIEKKIFIQNLYFYALYILILVPYDVLDCDSDGLNPYRGAVSLKI